jgi:hypothetical protein
MSEDKVDIVFGMFMGLSILIFICACICKRPRRDVPISEFLRHYEWNENDLDLNAALRVRQDVLLDVISRSLACFDIKRKLI